MLKNMASYGTTLVVVSIHAFPATWPECFTMTVGPTHPLRSIYLTHLMAKAPVAKMTRQPHFCKAMLPTHALLRTSPLYQAPIPFLISLLDLLQHLCLSLNPDRMWCLQCGPHRSLVNASSLCNSSSLCPVWRNRYLPRLVHILQFLDSLWLAAHQSSAWTNSMGRSITP